MDFKPLILFSSTLLLPLHDILLNFGLILNIIYVSYQFYIFKNKNNDNRKD